MCRQVSDEPTAVGRPRKRLTSPERWEVTQLIKAGVLDVTEYPTFDEEGQVRACRPCHSNKPSEGQTVRAAENICEILFNCQCRSC
jgi:hypothetical protein